VRCLFLLLVACGSRSEPQGDEVPVPVPVPVPDSGSGSSSDLTDLSTLVPDAIVDLRYATPDNFSATAVYPPAARCLLAPPVAARLARAADELRGAGYRLILWDCYRPFSVQKRFWQLVPDPRYVAEPKEDSQGRPVSGSIHSRAAAVDVSLADASGTPLAMPTAHDHFGPEAHRDHPLPADVAARMRVLDHAMTHAGFEGLATEWWHYAADDAWRYPLRDEPL
jgi:beta-N-acetylhexosaminidase/D-alanyl-D-alanine dipeptidase